MQESKSLNEKNIMWIFFIILIPSFLILALGVNKVFTAVLIAAPIFSLTLMIGTIYYFKEMGKRFKNIDQGKDEKISEKINMSVDMLSFFKYLAAFSIIINWLLFVLFSFFISFSYLNLLNPNESEAYFNFYFSILLPVFISLSLLRSKIFFEKKKFIHSFLIAVIPILIILLVNFYK